MQTIYYSTSNFIRHTGNLVDLNEFRRKQALAQQDSLARQLDRPQPEPAFQPRIVTIQPQAQTASRPRRKHRRDRLTWILDACASVGVVAMTLTFMLQVIS